MDLKPLYVAEELVSIKLSNTLKACPTRAWARSPLAMSISSDLPFDFFWCCRKLVAESFFYVMLVVYIFVLLKLGQGVN